MKSRNGVGALVLIAVLLAIWATWGSATPAALEYTGLPIYAFFHGAGCPSEDPTPTPHFECK